MHMNPMTVRSYKHAYDVRFVEDFAVALQECLIPGDVVTIDSAVLRLYQGRLAPLLETTPHIVIDPTEERKSYLGIEPFISRLIETGFRRNNRLIAFGGGIIQDITAFIASILFRGVDWFYFPTTLLAQCDSCIGSKTSVNFGSHKNQVGNFYPPKEVVIDLRFLDTLSSLDLRSGMGEMLHYYLISGEEDFARMLREYGRAFRDRNVLRELIRHSLDFKRGYVELDEFDQGPRNVFNYGHSFGHAIETLTGYAVPHGIAVSIGMDIANYLSLKLGYLSRELYERMRVLLMKNWGDMHLGDVVVDEFIRALTKDKKAVGSELRVILTRGPGKMFRTPLPLTPEIIEWLSEYLADFDRPDEEKRVCSHA